MTNRIENIVDLGKLLKNNQRGILKAKANEVITQLGEKGKGLIPEPKDRFPIRNAIATFIFSRSGTPILSNNDVREDGKKQELKEEETDNHYGEGATRKSISMII